MSKIGQNDPSMLAYQQNSASKQTVQNVPMMPQPSAVIPPVIPPVAIPPQPMQQPGMVDVNKRPTSQMMPPANLQSAQKN